MTWFVAASPVSVPMAARHAGSTVQDDARTTDERRIQRSRIFRSTLVWRSFHESVLMRASVNEATNVHTAKNAVVP